MSIDIRIFSDYTCPFCYLGTGLIHQLKQEFDIREEWLGYELHPEVPKEGVLLSEEFPDYDLDALFEELRAKGARYGYSFGEVKLLSNSKAALEASEFAREHGRHEVFHSAVFRAYFTEARDIGDISVLLDVASEVGLDAPALLGALSEHRYGARLEAVRREAQSYEVCVLPTFVFSGGQKIVGLRSIEAVRHVIKGLAFKPFHGL